jgi:ATP-dependent Clp protease adaptor protein ClpS
MTGLAFTMAKGPRRDPGRERRARTAHGSDGGMGVSSRRARRTQRPPLYKVLILNDDYTPMEFVVHVLERFFGMSHAQAFDLMLMVHKKGLAVVGVYSYEIAETKVALVMDFAQRHQHPLQCTMEKE